MSEAKHEGVEALITVRGFVLHQNKFLVVQRSPNDQRNASMWEAPGGKVNRGELPKTALAREILEENGIVIEGPSPLILVESKMIVEGDYTGMIHLTLFSVMHSRCYDVKLSDEHTDFRWIRVVDFPQISVTTVTQDASAQLKHYFL